MSWINMKIWTISTKFHYPYEWIFGTSSTPTYIIKEVTWNGYVNLTNAVANHLMELKAYWWTVNRDVPVWYTQLDYITLNKCFFDTWITPTTDTDYEIKFTIASNNTTQWIMWILNNATPTNNFYFMVSSWNKFLSALWSSAITLTWLADAVVDTDYIVKVNWETLTVNGVEATNFARWTLEATQTINLWCRKNSENNWLTWKLYYFKIWKWWKLVAHYIPCKRNSDDVLWYYDVINGTFGVLLTSYWTPVAWGNAVPTPEIPMNIVSNNWTIKARHQSWLPTGYKLLASIRNNSSATLDTGIQLASTDVIETRFFNNSDTWYWAWYWIYASWENTAFYANWTYYWYDWNNNKVNTYVSVDTLWHDVIHDFVNWKLTLDWVDTTFTPFSFTNTVNNKLFCRYYNNSYWYNVKWRICYFRVKRNWVLIQNLIPCTRLSDNTVWMYDLISWKFIWPDEWYTFEEWTVATDPIVLYTDWLVETIEDELNNTATAEMLLKVWDYVDEQEILSWSITRKVGVSVLDWTEGWKSAVTSKFYIDNDYMRNYNSMPTFCTHYQSVLASSTSGVGFGKIWLFATATQGVSSARLVIGDDNYTSVDTFKQFLTDQYNAWTPVIVVYPLKEETTETVTGQTINIQAWSNTIEITQASINDLWLYAKYKATS